MIKENSQEQIANSKYDELKAEIERLRNELARRGQRTALKTGLKYQAWESFEFVTKKKGAYGPTKAECLSYYAEKYDYFQIIDNEVH